MFIAIVKNNPVKKILFFPKKRINFVPSKKGTYFVSQKNDYILNFNDLPDGKHNFNYKLSNDFFAKFDEIDINQGEIEVEIVAEKQLSNIDLTFNIKGKVVVLCDRCLDEMVLPIEMQETIFVKIGGISDNNSDILTIKENEDFDISWLLYEFIATAVPMQHSHKDGQCNEETMKQFNRYIVVEKDDNFIKNSKNQTDPRWDVLKNINDNI